MRKHLTRVALAGLLGLVAVVLPAEAAKAPSFDEGDLVGEYVGVATGGLLLTAGQVPVVYLIKIVADGDGNLTFEAQRNIAASFTTVTEDCAYSIEGKTGKATGREG